jgi:hypothetical protein
LAADDKFGDHVAVTTWHVAGEPMLLGPEIPNAMVQFLKTLWPVAPWWLESDDRAWFFRAELVHDEQGWIPRTEDLIVYLRANRQAFGL